MPQHTFSEKCKCSLTSYFTLGKQKRYFVQKFRGQNIQCAQKCVIQTIQYTKMGDSTHRSVYFARYTPSSVYPHKLHR